LAGAEAVLAPGGRLAVISFHSLEDREVKNFMQHCAGRKKAVLEPQHAGWERDHVDEDEDGDEEEDEKRNRDDDGEKGDESDDEADELFLPSFRVVGKGGQFVAPSDAEVRSNPRARSAKLRVAERTRFPPLRPFG
jgi:16S rRNA (cytosine1402-N4)-methyltransferase